MYFIKQIHVVDSDSRRRAQVAFALKDWGYRALVYEDVLELERFKLGDSIVMLSDDDEDFSLQQLRDRLTARGESVAIAMYASSPNANRAVERVLAGAIDYLQWPILGDPVLVLQKLTSRALAWSKLERRRASALALVNNLSAREREVLTCLVAGLSNKAIASELNISPRTVEIHRANVFQKLAVRSTASAVRTGIYAGLDLD